MTRNSPHRARRGFSPFLLILLVASWLPVAIARGDETAVASPDCLVEVADRIQHYYESVRDIRADFHQVTRSITLGNAALGADAPSEGEVELAKPGRMRWVYRTTRPSQVVSDGSTLWIYDVEGAEAQRLPVQQEFLNSTALEFLLGDGQLVESFSISSETCAPDSKGQIELNLVPKQAANYERLAMRVDFESGELAESTLVDLFGNQTRIRFSNVQTNLSPPRDRFVFVVPDGVEVMDYQNLR